MIHVQRLGASETCDNRSDCFGMLQAASLRLFCCQLPLCVYFAAEHVELSVCVIT